MAASATAAFATVGSSMAASATAASATAASATAASATARSATGDWPGQQGKVHDDERGCRPPRTAGHSAYSFLQHQLFLLLSSRPSKHPEDVPAHFGTDLRLGLFQWTGPATVHSALARRRTNGHASHLLQSGCRASCQTRQGRHPG